MQKTIKKEAKTVEDAVQLALTELGVTSDRVKVTVLDEGKNGILGFGAKNAVVEVVYEEGVSEKIKSFLEPILAGMGIAPEIIITQTDEQIHVKMDCENSGIAIGRRGETLDAMQYLTSLVVNQDSDDYIRIMMDVSDYRLKREETLIGLAQRVAEKVARSHRNVTLEPMNPYERRIIHSALQGYADIETHSVGEEPNRKVVVRSTKGGYSSGGGDNGGGGNNSGNSDNNRGGDRNRSGGYNNRSGGYENKGRSGYENKDRNGYENKGRSGYENKERSGYENKDRSGLENKDKPGYGSPSPHDNPNSYRNRSSERIGYQGNPTASGSVVNPDAPVYKPFDIEDEIGKQGEE